MIFPFYKSEVFTCIIVCLFSPVSNNEWSNMISFYVWKRILTSNHSLYEIQVKCQNQKALKAYIRNNIDVNF